MAATRRRTKRRTSKAKRRTTSKRRTSRKKRVSRKRVVKRRKAKKPQKKVVGSKASVWNGKAKKTKDGLFKYQLVEFNGKIVSKKDLVGTKGQVFRGTRLKTKGGLTKADLCQNKTGKIVSKKRYQRGKKIFKSGIQKWQKAVMKARANLGITGFSVIKRGVPFLMTENPVIPRFALAFITAFCHFWIPLLKIFLPLWYLFLETIFPVLFWHKSVFVRPPLVFNRVPRNTCALVPTRSFFDTIFPLNSTSWYLNKPSFVFLAFPFQTLALEPTTFFCGFLAFRLFTTRFRDTRHFLETRLLRDTRFFREVRLLEVVRRFALLVLRLVRRRVAAMMCFVYI